MTDQIVAIVGWLLQSAGSIPKVGPILQIVMAVLLAAGGIATALFALWQAVVKVLLALSFLPKCGKLGDIAGALQIEENMAEGIFKDKVLPVLDRLSVIAPPKAK